MEERDNKLLHELRKEEEQRKSKILKSILWLMLSVFTSLFIVSILVAEKQFKATYWVYLLLVIVSIALLFIAKKGYLKLSAIGLIVIVWVAMIFFVWNGRGIYDAGNQAILVVILFATILINRKAALIVSALTLINFWILAIITFNGYRQPMVAPPINMSRDYTAILIASIALVFIYEGTMNRAIKRIRDLLLQKESAENKVQEKEQNYREIFESVDDAIFIHDIDTGKVLDFNLSACTMFGYQGSEMQSLTVAHLSAEEEGYTQVKAVVKIKQALERGIVNFEWRSKRANGSVFWSEVNLKSSLIGGEKRVLAVVRDISERKFAEEQLLANEEQYRTLVSNIPGAVYRCQIHAPWKTMYFSEDVIHMTGISASEFMKGNVKFGDLMFSEDKQKVDLIVEEAVSTHKEYFLEYRIWHKDKSIRWLMEKGRARYDEYGTALWLDGVMFDITDNKKITEEHQELSSLQSAILENAGYAIIATNADGAITVFNNAAEKMLGYSASELIGKQAPILFHDLEEVKKQAEKLSVKLGAKVEVGLETFVVEAKMGLPQEYEWTYIRKNGSRFPVQLKITALYKAGKIAGFLGIAVDISERIEAEKIVKSNELKFRTLFNSASDAIFIMQGNTFVDCNDATLWVFDCKREDIIGKSPSNFSPRFQPDGSISADVTLKRVKEALNGQNQFFEWRHCKLNGNTFEAEVSLNSINIDGEQFIQAIVRDITQRKQFEESLRISEDRLKATLQNTPNVAIQWYDVNGRVLFWNKASEILYGFTLEESIGKTIDKLIYGEQETKEFNKILQKIDSSGIPVGPFETLVTTKEGNKLTVLATTFAIPGSNKEKVFVCMDIDITEQKKIEKDLVQERNLLRTLFDTLPISTYMKDRESRFVIVNKLVSELIGYSSDELLGKTDFDFFPHEKALEFYTDEQNLIKTGRSILNKKEYMLDYKGNEKVLLTSKLPVFDLDNNVIGLLGTGLDITQIVKAEREIKALNESLELKVEERTAQLAQVNKDLESFAYSVSHDLRSPLRHIDGFIKILYSGIQNPSENIVNYYSKITSASKRMSTMIDDLLNFSRLGRKEMNVFQVDVNLLINEVLDLLKPETTGRVINWEIAELPKVLGDKALLKIVFENLISNAIKYTSRKEIAEIEIGTNAVNENIVEIFVRDNGSGFDMNYVDKLFGVFQRLHTNEEFEGTGIGLANVKQIISKHKGTVRAEGKLNEGACFTITLPR